MADSTPAPAVLPFAAILKPISFDEFTEAKKPRKPVYKRKGTRHFDEPLAPENAYTLVTMSDKKLAKWDFLPFMGLSEWQRRFGKKFKNKLSKAAWKERPIRYASHNDGYIYAGMAKLLSQIYHQWVKIQNLESNSIAYRATGLSNVDLSKMAFNGIAEMAPCQAYAYDISGFFDNIPHAKLLEKWKELRGGELPNGEYHVYRSLTRYAFCQFDEVETALKKANLWIDAEEGSGDRLCNPDIFRNFIRKEKKLITTNTKPYGVPQGSAMSAVLSNIVMMDFDRKMKAWVENSCGGIYRRYSDDILVVLPAKITQEPEEQVNAILHQYVGESLDIKPSKTVKCKFDMTDDGVISVPGPDSSYQMTLDYLGFEFDGARILLRSATLSQFWRRFQWKLKVELKRHERYREERIKRGEPKIRMKKLLAKFSAHNLANSRNTMGYAVKASRVMKGDNAILKQIAKVRKTLEKIKKVR